MTQAITHTDVNNDRGDLYVLINPASGNNTLSVNWTGSSTLVIGTVEFSGADQATCNKVADNTSIDGSSGANNPALAITSTTDGATVALAASVFGSSTSSDQTNIYTDNTGGVDTSASYAIGGTSNTHTFTFGNIHTIVGIHILAASGGGSTPTCKRKRLGVGC